MKIYKTGKRSHFLTLWAHFCFKENKKWLWCQIPLQITQVTMDTSCSGGGDWVREEVACRGTDFRRSPLMAIIITIRRSGGGRGGESMDVVLKRRARSYFLQSKHRFLKMSWRRKHSHTHTHTHTLAEQATDCGAHILLFAIDRGY